MLRVALVKLCAHDICRRFLHFGLANLLAGFAALSSFDTLEFWRVGGLRFVCEYILMHVNDLSS